jgi:non-specific protein-tyrosine kinase
MGSSNQMDLKSFYQLILRNLPLVLASTFLGLAISAGVTFTTTPIYQAKVQLFVSTPSSALDLSALVQGSSFSQQRVKSYAQIVNGPKTLNPIIAELKLPYSYEQLAAAVSATAPLDTVLISVTVSDPDPARARDIANAIGSQFSITANELEMTDIGFSDRVQVSMVKNASLPDSPSSPKPALNLLLGLILGFGLGVGLSFIRIIFDNRIKTEDDLDGSPVLASISFDATAEKFPLITQISRYAPRTEAFRQLRTNVQFINPDNPPKVIAVTSAVPLEGKSSTSANIALSFASAGFKTLLIEADMRRPKLNEYMTFEKKRPGLSDILSGRISGPVSAKLKKTEWSFEDKGLLVISSGAIPPNPSELLDSEAFKELVAYARKTYDYVIIDCPPTLLVADAAIIATQCDGVILSTRVGKTRRNQFLGARENITAVGANIIGVLMNMVPQSRTDEYGRKYGYGYGYGYRFRRNRSYRAYRSYGNYGSEYGYDPVHSYAPEEVAKKVEREIAEGDKTGSK